MVAAGVGGAAGETAGSVNDQPAGLLLHAAAQSGQQLRCGAEPVRFLQPEPPGIENMGIAHRSGGGHRQHRDQIGDRPGVDGNAVQLAPTDGHGIIFHGDSGAHGGQNIQHGPVALRGGRGQTAYRDSLRRQRAHAQEKGGVGPVALGRKLGGELAALSAADVPGASGFSQGNAAPPEGVLRHGDVGGGFQLAGYREGAAAVQQGQRHKQTGNILGGNVAGKGKFTGTQLAAAVKQVIFLTDGHAVGGQHRIQRMQRTLGQAPLHVKDHAGTQRACHRQKKAQGGAAFPAGKMAQSFRYGFNGLHGDKVAADGDLRAQRVEAADGGGDILGNSQTADSDRRLSQRGADQQPVGLRLGSGDGNGSRPGTGLNGLIH